MVTKNQKPKIDTQKLKRKYTSILQKKIINPQGNKHKEKEMDSEKLQKQQQKTSNKMAVCTYFSVISGPWTKCCN